MRSQTIKTACLHALFTRDRCTLCEWAPRGASLQRRLIRRGRPEVKDLAYFREFHLEGHTLAWPNGADFAPEYLHGLIQAEASTEAS
ncbi:MAG: DUF2442 domain-containing protein [Verrucomicrobiota bacterium JB022]|nr:DUF2442 domain-containing protein [Verrucomicrobiota bacterium JB022]